MGTPLDIEGFPASFTVAGHHSGDGPLGWTWHRTVGGMFTADAAAVGRLLPPGLHALRLSPRRGLVVVGGSLCEWHAGSLPAFRSLDMQVYAMVTAGSRPAPPVLPMAGLSAGGGRASFGAGFVPLLVVTTNRLARGIYRELMGWPVVLADVRAEDLPGHTRLTCSDAGHTLLDLVVRTDCAFREFAESQPWYGVRDGVLFRAVTAGKGSGGDVNGPGTARLELGDHAVVAPLRELGLSRGSWSASVCGTFEQTLTGPVVAVGPAPLAQPGSPPQADGADREAVVVSAAGRETPVDQGLAGLPFDPGADLRADPIPGLAEAIAATGAADSGSAADADAGAASDGPGANQGAKPSGALGSLVVAAGTAAELAIPRFSPHFAELLGLQPDDVYLDVACGPGVFLRRRARHVHRVAGIDHSAPQIAMARRLLRDRIAEGSAEVVEGDASVLPWPDETFTAVSCNCLDCFAPGKPARTVAEMHRVLRPGGRVVIGLEAQVADAQAAAQGKPAWLAGPTRLFARLNTRPHHTDPQQARRYEQRSGMSMFTHDELAALLTDAGFTDVELPGGTLGVYATARRG